MVKKQTLQEFEKCVCRFHLNDLKSYVFPEFPEVTWTEVKKIILKENINMNVKSVAKILARGISKFDENEIKKRIGVLAVIDISLHSSRREWTCFQMYRQRETAVEPVSNPDQIGKNVAQACRIASLSVIQHVICYDTLHWIVIISKKLVKGKGIVFQRPRFFAYSSGDNYLFGQKTTSKAMLMALANALGYDNITYAKLEGRHIPDLLQILLKRGGRGTAGLQPKPYKPAERVKDGDNIVILPNKNRRLYAESVFGKNPPRLSSLTIKASNCPWKTPIMEGETLDMKVVITAPNVYKCLTDFAEIGVLPTPFPLSMVNIVNSGKSTIALKPVQNVSK